MTDEGAEAVQAGTETEPEITDDTEVVTTAEDGVEPDGAEDGAVPDSPEASAAAPGRRKPNLLVAAVAAAFTVLLALTGYLGWQDWQHKQLTEASESAQRAAVSYAQVLTSIDSDNVDENFKEVLDGATGEFKDMYSQSSVELRQLLIENKATAHGIVVESAVQSASKDKAVVLLFVDQSVSNTKLPDPRIDRSRMKMTLEKVDGQWRASKVELP
ncbi:hypothetical protein [Mycolicibacterium sp.]|uniref:hypothetical protein n=1 Tax=Mycolicibacterium sp. TaxID=2320850 RepID=UPI0025D0ED19|nr:hypothetical protein [Mycolicibacterium sp.]